MATLTALSNLAKASIANSGATELSVLVSIDDIQLDTHFKDLFPDAEIASSEAECEVLVKGRRSILPYFFALSCVLSLILFGCIFEGIIMEGEPL